MVHLRYRLEDFAAFVIYPQETKTSLDMSISDGKVWDISGFFLYFFSSSGHNSFAASWRREISHADVWETI